MDQDLYNYMWGIYFCHSQWNTWKWMTSSSISMIRKILECGIKYEGKVNYNHSLKKIMNQWLLKHNFIQRRVCDLITVIRAQRGQRSAQPRHREGYEDKGDRPVSSPTNRRGHGGLAQTHNLPHKHIFYLIPSSFLSHFMPSWAHLSRHPLKRPGGGPEVVMRI